MKRLIVFLLLSCLASRGAEADPPLAVAPFNGRQAIDHQTAWSHHLGVPVQIANSLGMKLNLIPPGEFTMGSPASEFGHFNNETQHRVQITRPFYLSVYEVTQKQYERVMGNNPSIFKGANKPVEAVTWRDAVEFCRKLGEQEGCEQAVDQYRLPTEAEWEYACRAGTTTTYSFGDIDRPDDVYRLSVPELGEYAWYQGNSGKESHPVGELKPNAWGLYDMHGNVYEWCQDWRDDYDLKVVSDPTGPASGERRVLRGGAFDFHPVRVRAAFRRSSFFQPDFRDRARSGGFRLARTYPLSP